MRNFLIASAAALGLIATGAIAQDSNRTLTAQLTGEAEVPGPGDPDGRGIARVKIDLETNQLCYNIRVRNIDPATAAHIHEAVEGSSGPVRVGLTAPSTGTSSGCATITRALALDILADPAEYYVNVHNPAFPGGAVRGQLGN
jgi:hypothetical protein